MKSRRILNALSSVHIVGFWIAIPQAMMLMLLVLFTLSKVEDQIDSESTRSLLRTMVALEDADTQK